MAEYSPENLASEIQQGETERDNRLAKYQTLRDQYAMDSAEGMCKDWRENLTHEFLAYMVPKIVYDNPRVSVRSRRATAQVLITKLTNELAQSVQAGMLLPEDAEAILQQAKQQGGDAEALEHGANRWIADEDYHGVLDRVCVDMLMSWGVVVSGLGTMPDHPERRWPKAFRLSPKRYIIDPKCLHKSEAMWEGHWRPINKDRLLKQASAEDGWDIEAIKKINADDDSEGIDRQELQVYEVWFRNYDGDGIKDWVAGDPEFNGAIFTLARARVDGNNDVPAQIRKPRKFYGPRWGPYSMFGSYCVPDSPYPMSPLLATYSQQNELQAHATSMSRNAAQYKRIVLVSDKNPELAELIKSGGDQFVYPLDDEGFDKNQVVVVEVAGVSDQQMKHYDMLRERWERSTGMSDTSRGETDPDVTATSDAIASEALDIRTSYIQSKFAEGVKQNMRTNLWYMANDERISFPLGPEAGEALGMFDPVFTGGITDDGFSFDDLELTVDPYSMERTNQALLQKRILEAFNLILSSAPAMMQLPGVDWRKFLQKIGDALNLPDLADMVDLDSMQMMAQHAQQMGVGQPQTMSGSAAVQTSGQMMGGLVKTAVEAA